MGKTLHHYAVVRGDLSGGEAMAQLAHAIGESCEGPLPTGTYAYVLEARDEDHLWEIAQWLWDAEIPHKVIEEPDPPHNNAATAIGVFPTLDKMSVHRVLSKLPLFGKRRT